jgi:dTMP kinase
MLTQGFLVTFEGGDGAGKSTLMKGLYRLLEERGESVIQTRAPGGTHLGEKIRSLLLESKTPLSDRCELFLFLADRAEHMQEVIFPALSEGKIVLCDRFNDSTIAYQGIARCLDGDKVKALCLFATNGKTPDLTFYLDISPKVGIARSLNKTGEKDRIESESLDFHEKIRQAFLHIAGQDPKRVRVLDATQSPETLLKQALKFLDDIFFAHR